MTIREGVARGAPKNIPPKKLLMVSGSLNDNIIQYEDGHFHCISNKIQWTFLYAELDFSRGIWAAARDGEEDRIKHLLSRFLNAATAHLSSPFFPLFCCVPIHSLLSSLLPWHFQFKTLLHADFHPRGTDVSQRDNGGYTGLHYAARAGHLNVVRLLLQVLNMCLSHLRLVYDLPKDLFLSTLTWEYIFVSEPGRGWGECHHQWWSYPTASCSPPGT